MLKNFKVSESLQIQGNLSESYKSHCILMNPWESMWIHANPCKSHESLRLKHTFYRPLASSVTNCAMHLKFNYAPFWSRENTGSNSLVVKVIKLSFNKIKSFVNVTYTCILCIVTSLIYPQDNKYRHDSIMPLSHKNSITWKDIHCECHTKEIMN